MIPMGNTCRKRAASAILYPRKDGMDMERPEIERLLASPWGEADPTLAALKASEYGKELQKALALLDREVLYESWMHGAGHIERVMVLSAELAREGALPLRETKLLLLAASYHDIGRVDDSRDPAHGRHAERQGVERQVEREERADEVRGDQRQQPRHGGEQQVTQTDPAKRVEQHDDPRGDQQQQQMIHASSFRRERAGFSVQNICSSLCEVCRKFPIRENR